MKLWRRLRRTAAAPDAASLISIATRMVIATSVASVAGKHMLPDLLHGEERKVWGDGGYQGQTGAIRAATPQAQNMTCRWTKYKDYVDEEAQLSRALFPVSEALAR